MSSLNLVKVGSLVTVLMAVGCTSRSSSSEDSSQQAASSQPSVKPGTYKLLGCMQPLSEVNPETNERAPVLDAEKNPVSAEIKLNVKVASNGEKSLDGELLFPGFTPVGRDHVHSSRILLKSLKVTQVKDLNLGLFGYDLLTKGVSLTFVEGDNQVNSIAKVKLGIDNGSDNGSLEIIEEKSQASLVNLFLDFNCPIQNTILLKSLSKK